MSGILLHLLIAPAIGQSFFGSNTSQQGKPRVECSLNLHNPHPKHVKLGRFGEPCCSSGLLLLLFTVHLFFYILTIFVTFATCFNI